MAEAIMNIGRVCIKLNGRNAGEKIVITKVMANNKVKIVGKTIKGKECNIMHLYPTKEKIDINEDASQDEVKVLL